MENFNKALNEVINSWMKLSEEWEKIEPNYSNEVSNGYPFEKDFREIVRDLIEWRENIKASFDKEK